MAGLGGITVEIDNATWDDLTNSFDGPVGQLVAELSAKATGIAKTAVHVWPGTPRSTIWNPATSTAALPSGYTRESIHPHLAKGTRTGRVYGGVNSAAFPTWFLEKRPAGAEQMYARYPFLTVALDELTL